MVTFGFVTFWGQATERQTTLNGSCSTLWWGGEAGQIAQQEVEDGRPARTGSSSTVGVTVGLDFDFYKALGDLEVFTEKWAYEGIVCSGKEQQLLFGDLFATGPL